MAKGLRSTVKKRNRAKLRETVFGPAHDARTERLSAKLQELASQPRVITDDSRDMGVDAAKDSNSLGTRDQEQSEEMDIDSSTKPRISKGRSASSTGSHTKRSAGIRKMSKRKEKNLSVFPKYRLKRYQKSAARPKK